MGDDGRDEVDEAPMDFDAMRAALDWIEERGDLPWELAGVLNHIRRIVEREGKQQEAIDRHAREFADYSKALRRMLRLDPLYQLPPRQHPRP